MNFGSFEISCAFEVSTDNYSFRTLKSGGLAYIGISGLILLFRGEKKERNASTRVRMYIKVGECDAANEKSFVVRIGLCKDKVSSLLFTSL